MKNAKKVLSLVLSAVMLLTLFIPVYAESQEKEQSLVVFVEGIGARDIYDVNTGETLFPPSTNAILTAVGTALPGITQAIANQDISLMKDSLVEAVTNLFLPIACDETGTPSANTAFDYEPPTDEEILEIAESDDPDDRIIYCYDWRLSMQQIASDLNDFIEHIVEVTGIEKVSLIGFSMGTAAALSYVKMYGYDRLESLVLLAGAYIGTSNCGEPFSGQIALDSEALVRFVDGMIDTDDSLLNVFIASLIHALYISGVMDDVVDLGTEITDELKSAVYEEVFTATFATLPGLWSLVPAEDYEPAKKLLANSLDPDYIEIIDWYHYEVQNNAEELINGCLERGIKFGIICKYGYPTTPCISDINSLSDSVIDTKYESFGATTAPVTEPFDDDYVQKVENGHDCISPDRMIDSSTCKFCAYTWFAKNVLHSNEYGEMIKMCRNITEADGQITVWDSESEYPQFNIFNGEEVVPLTAENNTVDYSTDVENENALTLFVKFVKDYFSYVKAELERFRNTLIGYGNRIAAFGEKIKNLGNIQC